MIKSFERFSIIDKRTTSSSTFIIIIEDILYQTKNSRRLTIIRPE